MTIPETIRYPRFEDKQTIYLKNISKNPNIIIGEYTMYHDFRNDPMEFEKTCVCYQYPINQDRLIIGKFCSIACGVKFLFNSANHTLNSLSTYPFPLFYEAWKLDKRNVASAWDHKGDIHIGNDVWIGFEAVILAGVHIGDGAIIGARSVVTRDVAPYSIVAGVPAKYIRHRFSNQTIQELLDVQWWNFTYDKVQEVLPFIQKGDIASLKMYNDTKKDNI